MNIVQIILNLLSSGSTTTKIASVLGISQEQAQKGIGAAVPTLLAGLLGSASKPGGAATLANTLARQDEKSLDQVPNLFERGETASQGNSTLGSLLGGSVVNQISGALARFTGISEGITGKLLGFIAPVILGALAKHTKGLDASGILRMLQGQKENISAAMPPGLGRTLSSAVPGFDKIFESREQPSAGHEFEREPEDRTPVEAGRAGSGETGWSALKWVIPLVVLALALYYLPRMVNRGGREYPPAVGESAAPAGDEKGLIDKASAVLKNTRDQLASIKDEASAEAALPKLRDDASQLRSLQGHLGRLTEPARKSVRDHLQPLVENVREAARPVLAMPTVGEKVKPTLDALFAEADKLVGNE